MRIVGGSARGRRLQAPRGRGLRPTSDRVREALFDILAVEVPDAAFLDGYAGTGAVGLEALSRGARSACLVEASRKHVEILRRNVERSGLGAGARVLAMPFLPALAKLAAEGERFDLVFLDPPYGERDEAESALQRLAAGGILAPECRIVLELAARDRPPGPPGLTVPRVVRHGDTSLAFYRIAPPD